MFVSPAYFLFDDYNKTQKIVCIMLNTEHTHTTRTFTERNHFFILIKTNYTNYEISLHLLMNGKGERIFIHMCVCVMRAKIMQFAKLRFVHIVCRTNSRILVLHSLLFNLIFVCCFLCSQYRRSIKSY